LKNLYSPVIVILDTESDQFDVIELPDDEFASDIRWVKNASIIGNSIKIPVWRLGLIYCTNRESRIFQVDIDGKNLRKNIQMHDFKLSFLERLRIGLCRIFKQSRAGSTRTKGSTRWPVCDLARKSR